MYWQLQSVWTFLSVTIYTGDMAFLKSVYKYSLNTLLGTSEQLNAPQYNNIKLIMFQFLSKLSEM